ncbi:MAG: site-specific integrase, partial [Anaeroplasmataceae bacterium]|nr:site-specific integrase [Anaeroplasmataceae bacterium]
IKDISVRNQVLVSMLLQTGVRRTEICNIKVTNVDLKNNWIYLEHTKTNSPRYIFFDDTLKEKISTLIKPDSVFLFTSKGNCALSPSTLDSIFERMKKRLNIKMLSPHLLRHTFATYVLRNGGNLEEVRLLLGHASYQMTQRYLHLLQDELKLTSIRYNPMSSL